MTTRTPRILLASAALLPIAAVTLAACGGGSSKAGASATTVVTTVNGQPATIDVANSGLGKILVDSQGRTVYLFGKDSGTTSECTGACASNWPPVTVNGTPTAGSGAIASMVGTTTRSDGTSQVTYNGHPLYLFKGDSKAGDTNGQGITAFGGSWFVLAPSGNQVAASTPSTTGGGSSGY